MKKSLSLLWLFATVSSVIGVPVVGDDFNSYANGALVTTSGGIWATHSGTAGQVDVASGGVNLTTSESEDVNTLLNSAPATGFLYASFTVNFSVLPNAAGTYFAHFKDATTGFRDRIWASTANAASGNFRLGVGNSSAATNASGQFALDLSLGTTYTVVTRYNLDSGVSTLWINPLLESDLSVDATDAVGGLANTAFALRQSTGIGTLVFDNLLVDTTFAGVMSSVPEPSTYLMLLGGALMIVLVVRRQQALI
jgi:hypothetical protein